MKSSFRNDYRVLNRAKWSSRALRRILFGLLVHLFVAKDDWIVLGRDEPIQRRRGARIAAPGVYRDPVRSSKEFFVKTKGLRWISMMLLTLVFAGNETTGALIGNCLLHLLRDRSHWQMIRDHPERIANIVEETLRINSPAFGFFRIVTEPVELGGITLPRGARVFVGISSANHDETQFPDPEEFRPERDNLGRHMAFGNGIHFCLGAPLARLITRIALEMLSTLLPDLYLLPDQQLTYKRSVLMHSLTHLLATRSFGLSSRN